MAQLRSVLLSVEARERERVWLKGQVVGELDDARLVDGVLGEKNVFKRRGHNPNPPPSQRQHLPKRLIFVVDVSSSMANFNADERLDRLCATTLMVMEAFTGLGHKYEYAIVGHSGETAWLPLVAMGSPPSGRAARLGVIRAMIQHSSTCRSGDHTLDAGRRAVLELASEPADDRFVFLVSDANLEGYGCHHGVWHTLLGALLLSRHMLSSLLRRKRPRRSQKRCPWACARGTGYNSHAIAVQEHIQRGIIE